MSTSKETVLVIGATGHIGVAAVIGALRSGRRVLAIVRNQTSAERLFKYAGKDGITTVEADISKDDGVEGVVERVKKGELPAFQHVYVCPGGAYPGTNLLDLTPKEMRELMHVDFELSFLAYRPTVSYLLKENHPNSSFTLCTGASGLTGTRAGPGITQGALFSLAATASRELEQTNVRFVEVLLWFRVEVDVSNLPYPAVASSEYARVYEKVLASDLRSVRVTCREARDIEEELKVSRTYVDFSQEEKEKWSREQPNVRS